MTEEDRAGLINDALDRLAAGPKPWNDWRTEDGRDIIFDEIVFGADIFKKLVLSELNWKRVNFHKCTFEGVLKFQLSHFFDISFEECIFNQEVYFSGCRFYGVSSFNRSVFEKEVKFSGAHFEMSATFGEVTFENACSFPGCLFGGGGSFMYSSFWGGGDFRLTRFLDVGEFNTCDFKAGVEFGGAEFLAGAIFDHSVFHDSFELLGYRDGEISRVSNEIKEDFPEFIFLKNFEIKLDIDQLKKDEMNLLSLNSIVCFEEMNLTNRSFKDIVNMQNALFMQPPDFRGTENHDQLNLQGTQFDFGYRNRIGVWVRWTSDPSITGRLRRLRKIASDIHAQDAERDLFILERKAERYFEWEFALKSLGTGSLWERFKALFSFGKPFLNTLMLYAFSLSCDCGRSFARPVFWIVSTIGMFHAVYKNLLGIGNWTSDALATFTLFNSFPFLAASRSAYLKAVEAVFPGDYVPVNYQLLGGLQTILVAIFLFLALLSIRNHFKIR